MGRLFWSPAGRSNRPCAAWAGRLAPGRCIRPCGPGHRRRRFRPPWRCSGIRPAGRAGAAKTPGFRAGFCRTGGAASRRGWWRSRRGLRRRAGPGRGCCAAAGRGSRSWRCPGGSRPRPVPARSARRPARLVARRGCGSSGRAGWSGSCACSTANAPCPTARRCRRRWTASCWAGCRRLGRRPTRTSRPWGWCGRGGFPQTRGAGRRCVTAPGRS